MKTAATKKRRAIAPKRQAPKPRKKTRGRRRNPSELEAAAALSEKFHGRPARKVTEHKIIDREITDLTELGKAVSLDIETPDGRVIQLTLSNKTKVCSDPKGGQLYLVGGDQSVNLKQFGIADTGKHHVILGEGVQIVYHTRKSFDKFEPVDYVHDLGEETGETPTVCYDVLNQRLFFVDGAYAVEDVEEGEVSPGIVN